MVNKKRKKVTRFRGTHTHGRGAKKKARGSGNRGGVGRAGSGKKADQKKDLINFPPGKDKTLRRKKKIKLKVINLSQISEKFAGKKEVVLKGFKILGEGELKEKITITADAASESAIGKVKKAGGDIMVKKA
ncbi:uL15 family ribosomal protein [Candidatus Pacearchaeota archaeon]|nr:50S ribosomal protein L15P [uncultured archaeon]MBS3077454.1 uL15 family ribosomal protein [Candidatus Pacearchaeota archaeon]